MTLRQCHYHMCALNNYDPETASFVLHRASIEGCFLDLNESPSATNVVVVVVVILLLLLLLLLLVISRGTMQTAADTKWLPVQVYSTRILVFTTKAYVGRAEVTYVAVLIIYFCIMLFLGSTFLVGPRSTA